jgi:hypothetical protein
LIQIALPDYTILLGRRNLALSTSVASPRFVFVPTDGKAGDFQPYGGLGGAPAQERGSLEQQAEKLSPQLATQHATFEVYVSGAAVPPSPDFGDFDATETLVQSLYAVLFDAIGPARAQVLHESWPSQLDPRDPRATGTQTQRGQQWKGVIDFQLPMTNAPLSFVPVGTSLQLVLEPVNPGSTDATVINIHPGSSD